MNTNQVFTILQNAGGIRAARIITENTEKFNRIKVWRMVRALRQGVPVAKIIHKKWFYGLPFYTNKHTLDPRPDTETLVTAVIADCKTNFRPHILDLGTGTGCILGALVKNINGASGTGIDKSLSAIRVARQNMKKLEIYERVKIHRGTFQNPRIPDGQHFDIIVSNPPYIAKNDTRVNQGAMHDPKMALYAKNNGLAAYTEIAENVKRLIKPGGQIYLELGHGQYNDVRKIFTNSGWKFIRNERDLGNIIRVVVFKR